MCNMTEAASPGPIRQVSTQCSPQQTWQPWWSHRPGKEFVEEAPHCCSWWTEFANFRVSREFSNRPCLQWERSILQHWNTFQEHADVNKILMENCHIFSCSKLEGSADFPVTNQLSSCVFQGLQVYISLADHADHWKSVGPWRPVSKHQFLGQDYQSVRCWAVSLGDCPGAGSTRASRLSRKPETLVSPPKPPPLFAGAWAPGKLGSLKKKL